MKSEEIEFLISQHADGVLDPARAAEVERLIAADAGARAVWIEHRRLSAVLREGSELPPLDWDRVADSISSHIAGFEAEEEAAREERMRIRRAPIGAWAARLAAVAAVLAIGLFVRRAGETEPVAPTSPALARVMQVRVPSAAEAVAALPPPKVVRVSIAPPPAAGADPTFAAFAFDELRGDGPRIVVAAGAQRPQNDPFDGY